MLNRQDNTLFASTFFRDMVQILFDWAKNTMRQKPSSLLAGQTLLASGLLTQGLDLSHEEIRAQSIERLEKAVSPVVAKQSEYADDYIVTPHSHSRAQLIYARSGVVTVTTSFGRWMVPPEHALWVPARTEHSVSANGHVNMCSIYVMPGAIVDLPTQSRVVGLTDLMRSLILEAVQFPIDGAVSPRARLIMDLILEEIPLLPERPLGLPMPAEMRLAALCKRFLQNPSAAAPIDVWAQTLGMSRRSFTRAFRAETGLSLSDWRQQACIFAALPRLAKSEPITTVALDLGYESAAAFTTMFKRMTGSVPSRYLLSMTAPAKAV